MMTLQESLKYGIQMLTEADIEDASTDAWYLLEHVCKMDKNYYYMHMTETLNTDRQVEYESLLKLRAHHIPLQHITGTQEFMGLQFQVNEHVLVPRMETEILVEETAKLLQPGMQVLDMCTGSGCIIISLMKLVKDITGTACDISTEALAVAQQNAKTNEVQISFRQSDLFQNIDGMFDVIVSNPPYIPTADIEELETEVKVHDPMIALDGGADGYNFYRRIIVESVQHLKKGGALAFEIGYNQGQCVAELMEETGFTNVRQIQDLQKLDRVVIGTLETQTQEEKYV